MLRRRKTNLIWLLMLVVIAIGVGSAFTAANTFDATAGNKLGYGAQNVTGANVVSMHYTLHPDGVTVDGVTFDAAGNVTLGAPKEHAFVGFTVSGTPGTTVDCGTGVYDGVGNVTTFTCDVSGLGQDVASIDATDIAVSN